MTNALAFATATTRSPGSATETCQFASERAPLSTIRISPSKSPGLAGAGTGWPEAAGPGWAPALLSCGDTEPKAEVRYEAIAFTRIR